ncbi:MAG: PEP-CTERM sorting domain-containing protein [Puniceicoccaceae bacterium]
MKLSKKLLVFSVSLLAFAHLGFSQYIAEDNYIGGVATNAGYTYSDTIGNVFELTHTETFLSGGNITINIHGNYFDNIISGTGLNGTTLGDLFISTNGLAWGPGDDTTLDYIGGTTQTIWDYGVKLGVYDNQSGTDITSPVAATVHSDPSDIIQSTASGVWREFQEWQFNPGDRTEVGSASWFIDTAGNVANDDFLSITIFDYKNVLGVDDANELSIHWTMTCGNDVIETTPVPEPSTIGILGAAGLMGVLFVRRRLAKRK